MLHRADCKKVTSTKGQTEWVCLCARPQKEACIALCFSSLAPPCWGTESQRYKKVKRLKKLGWNAMDWRMSCLILEPTWDNAKKRRAMPKSGWDWILHMLNYSKVLFWGRAGLLSSSRGNQYLKQIKRNWKKTKKYKHGSSNFQLLPILNEFLSFFCRTGQHLDSEGWEPYSWQYPLTIFFSLIEYNQLSGYRHLKYISSFRDKFGIN